MPTYANNQRGGLNYATWAKDSGAEAPKDYTNDAVWEAIHDTGYGAWRLGNYTSPVKMLGRGVEAAKTFAQTRDLEKTAEAARKYGNEDIFGNKLYDDNDYAGPLYDAAMVGSAFVPAGKAAQAVGKGAMAVVSPFAQVATKAGTGLVRKGAALGVAGALTLHGGAAPALDLASQLAGRTVAEASAQAGAKSVAADVVGSQAAKTAETAASNVVGKTAAKSSVGSTAAKAAVPDAVKQAVDQFTKQSVINQYRQQQEQQQQQVASATGPAVTGSTSAAASSTKPTKPAKPKPAPSGSDMNFSGATPVLDQVY